MAERALRLAGGRRRRGVTRLLGQHPAIEVELDAAGRPTVLRWPGVRERVEACNHWRIEEDWWRRPLVRDYFKVVGPRLLALVYRDGRTAHGTWSASTTDALTTPLGAAAEREGFAVAPGPEHRPLLARSGRRLLACRLGRPCWPASGAAAPIPDAATAPGGGLRLLAFGAPFTSSESTPSGSTCSRIHFG